MPSLFDLDRPALGELLDDQPKYRVDQVWDGIHQRAIPVAELSNVPKAVRERLADKAPEALEPITSSVSDNGQTLKWLWKLDDGKQVETVLMHYKDRSTVCVSSQAGCAMGCTFCATGQAGFDRHLTTGEIVEQVIRSAREAAPRRVSNIVFMGMGEPLANFDPTWAAIERIHGDIGIGARSITLSTVGIIPGIRRVTEEALPVTLAVSLHAANDEKRNELVPINKRYPLDDLADSLIEYRESHNRRVSFEWAMIADVNDSDTDARELAKIARRVRAHVNLIPLNPTPGYPVVGSRKPVIHAFRQLLEDQGVQATVRNTRGVEIDAACGQLAARHKPTPAGIDQPVQITS